MSRKPLVRSLATSVALAVAATGLITVAAGPASAATSRSAIVSAAVGQLGSNGCGIVNCGVQWCAYFSRWAWQQGGVDVSALGGTVTTFVNYGDSNGTWHNPGTYTPQPGDAMIFGGGNYPTKASGGAHVGIVEKVNANGTLTEIGGNQGGLVTEVTGTADQIEHYLEGSSSNFLGYVSPVGAGAVTPPPTGFADGTFVNVTETGQVYRIAGGAPIAVTDWNNVGGFQSYTTISQAQLNALPTVPAD
ncbi:CHAP domain-containing protein, partial [Kitasatospora sp. NPDC088391]|uniref:CHAP domain-containing protein n=1 Tax=Kitasatospora sp. NPDC088391 TaxID=3364074 RepID=UPI003808E8F3